MGNETTEVAPEGGGKPEKNKNDTLPRDQLANGPLYSRGCTDMLCCIIFLVFLVGMVGTSGYGFLHGDVKLLITGWDADRHGCGYSEETKDFPFLYWPTIDLKAA